MRFVLAWLALVCVTPAFAAPPAEVPPDAVFGADRATLTWSPAAGADAYDVYRGGDPAAHDATCRVFRTAATSATLSEDPPPGALLTFLVAGVNADGEGSLGDDSSGAPRPNLHPCADVDGDLVPDNLDNCPAAANPSQADQDGGGVGDACDPDTYDFESDAPGGSPAAMTRVGPLAQSLTVKEVDGMHGVSYDLAAVGASDRFDRVPAGLPLQDTTVWVDVQDVPQVASLELWSDGAWGWNAGNGVILQIQTDDSIRFYDRHGQSVPAQIGPVLPLSGRLRLRLVKGPGSTSTLHVDAWDGSSWTDDYATFPIADDHRYTGLDAVVADYYGGPRAIERITVKHTIPQAALTLRKDFAWSCDWKLFQRDAQGLATVPLRFYYRLAEPGRVQARVVPAGGGGALPGFDWGDHAVAVPAADGAGGTLDLAGVPAGGNYDVEVRLVRDADGSVLGTQTLREIAVGDVFLAGGQSNMSGYSGSLDGAEAPIDEVHLFGNDDVWKRASEPMDDGTDQVDLVSAESPQHTLLLRFGKEIYQATGVPVAIIPGPLGGTNLYSQWQRNESDHADRGTLYGSLLYRALAQNDPVPPKGFLWYQGESDAGQGLDAYKQNLQRLMAEYREDLDAPGLAYGVVQLATYDLANLTTWLPIQEAQRQAVLADPLAVLAVPIDQPRNDAIHLNVAGYKTIGARLAREMLAQVYGLPIEASARLASVQLGPHGRSIDLAYDKPVTGGEPTLYFVEDGGTVVSVDAVSASGSTITLALARRIGSGALVTYGWSRSPGAAWVRDAAGTAVAVFQNVPVP